MPEGREKALEGLTVAIKCFKPKPESDIHHFHSQLFVQKWLYDPNLHKKPGIIVWLCAQKREEWEITH